MRLADEKHTSSTKKKQDIRGTNGHRNRFQTFQPTKIERLAIKEDERTVEEVLGTLQAHMIAGALKLSVGYNDAQHSFYIIAREGSEDWQKARALSVWHSSLERCVRILEYALSGPFRGFPESTEPVNIDDLDW